VIPSRFILNAAGKPVVCHNLRKWGEWVEKNDRQTAETNTFGYRISTVFLGLDHNFTGEGLPVLWETMVFPDLPSGEIQKRYSSREDALAGHEKIVEKVRKALRRKRARRD